MPEYTLLIDGLFKSIRRTSDGASIPIDPANADFQAFLIWNAQQETPIDWESE